MLLPTVASTPASPQDPQMLLDRNGGKPPLTMQSFTKLVDSGSRRARDICRHTAWLHTLLRF